MRRNGESDVDRGGGDGDRDVDRGCSVLLDRRGVGDRHRGLGLTLMIRCRTV